MGLIFLFRLQPPGFIISYPMRLYISRHLGG